MDISKVRALISCAGKSVLFKSQLCSFYHVTPGESLHVPHLEGPHLPDSDPRPGLETFSVIFLKINIFSFLCCRLSVLTTLLCCVSTEATLDYT